MRTKIQSVLSKQMLPWELANFRSLKRINCTYQLYSVLERSSFLSRKFKLDSNPIPQRLLDLRSCPRILEEMSSNPAIRGEKRNPRSRGIMGVPRAFGEDMRAIVAACARPCIVACYSPTSVRTYCRKARP